MFSSLTVQRVTELFRTALSVRRRQSFLVLLIAASLFIGAGVAAARKVMRSESSQTVSPLAAISPAVLSADYTHRVTPVNAVPFDVSSIPVTTVSAASFESVPVAPEAIVAAFGTQLASQTVIATDADPNQPGIQLPTELAGTTVEVKGRKAGLFFVSPNQVNYLVPAATEAGTVDVTIKNGTNISSGTVMVTQVAPAIFTANSNGRGVPAAYFLRFRSGGSNTEFLSQYSISAGRYITKPIDMGPESDSIFLVLFLSGIRRAADDNNNGSVDESVRVLIGGNEIRPVFAGRQPEFAGLDQINVQIPRSLIGRGVVDVSVVGVGYAASNVASIEIAGTQGASPPQIGGLSGVSALAGTELTINGSGFSPIKEENFVRISGRDAAVVDATTTQLRVMVPFGVETGTVSVRTSQGEGQSADVLQVRTSVSGIVENTQRQPLSGVTLRVVGASVPTVVTNAEGSFVLPDVPEGGLSIDVDGGTVPTTPSYPKLNLKINAGKNRDNQFSPPTIALQQSTGGSGTVGSGSFAGTGASAQSLESSDQAVLPSVAIQTGGFQLQVPTNTAVTTPTGGTSATLFLTPLLNGRTPVQLPYGYYSTSIVQITPFNVKLNPGAKLIFPNTDKFPAGTPLTLFRYDSDSGRFIQEKALVAVSADGQRIETEDGAIKVTSYYFASLLRSTTTITGRVLESDGKTPAQRALVTFKGQEAFTDGNGSYILRFVTVADNEMVTVDVSSLRASARVDREVSATAVAVTGGITKMPDVILPNERSNRPPTVLAPPKLEIDEGKTLDVPIVVTDPDVGQNVIVTVSGASFATISKSLLGVSAYVLKLAPAFNQSGDYTVVITATDTLQASAKQSVAIVVRDVNRPPSATSQTVTVDEDTMQLIKLEGTDPDSDRITYKIASPPANGVLSGDPPNVTYKPNLNFNGTDQFTFVTNDGKVDSAPATVGITVRPVNDPPTLTVPSAQTVNEGQLLSFAVSAADPDAGQTLTITAVGTLPEGATFATATPTSSQFRWTPGFNQAGTYTITFKVVDSATPQLSDMKDVRITVNDVSLLSVPNLQTINEGQSLLFEVVPPPNVTGPVTITATDLPTGAAVSNQVVNGTQFRWTPSFLQAGSYTVSFKATVNSPTPISETKQVQINVYDVVRDLAKESTSFSVWGAAGPLPQSVSDDGDALGASVATGDLNGDGIADLAVGAPGANGAGFDNGKVYVFFGRANLGGQTDLAQQKADVEILGEAGHDRFGSSLAIGDLNGDGKNDLVIGAPYADPKELPDAGKVYVVFGGFTAGTNDSITKLVGATILGSQRSERLGTSIAAGFIHTKNGPAADLIVGAPGADIAGATSLADAGAVFVFWGGSELTKTIDLATTSPGYTVVGTQAGGEIGMTLAVGNFNGDDFRDLAIGAPSATSIGGKGSGAVYVALGSSALEGLRNTSQASSLILFGVGDNSGLGSAVAMGDLNGDGKDDLVMSAVGADVPGTSRQKTGAAYVIYGGANLQGRSADLTIFGVGANNDVYPDALGKVLSVGDFNGDGIVDLALGAPGADNVDSARDPIGAVYVIYGSRNALMGVYDLATKQADWTAWGADPGDNLGGGSMAIGNINASEPADVILGMPKGRSINNTRIDAGEVRTIYGFRR